MSLGTAFSLQGATPFKSGVQTTTPSTLLQNPVSPQSKALNKYSSLSDQQMTDYLRNKANTPTTPVKSVTTADGTKTEYHAPTVQTQPTQNTNQNNSNVSGLLDSIKKQALDIQSQVNQPATYGGIINKVVDQSSQPNANTQQAVTGLMGGDYQSRVADAIAAQKRAVSINQDLNQAINDQTKTAIPIQFQQGRQGAIQRDYGVQAEAATEAAKNASAIAGLTQTGLNQAGTLSNTNQQIGQQGLLGAGSLASPIQVPYNNQLIDPKTGQPVNGGGASGSLNDAVQSVVQKLQSGQMTYNDALTALSGYGQGGVNALQQSLPQGFNIAQSNTLAGQQGSIGVNYQLAQNALTNVESLMKNLGFAQGTNIPALNAVGNFVSTQTGLGSEQTRAVTGAVQSLRNAYASLLASSKGGTPTDYSSQAVAEIPNNPTPNDIAAIKTNMETLGKARANILGNPGTAGSQSNGGLFNW